MGMAPGRNGETQLEELPIETRSVKALQLQQLKRSFDLFAGNYGSKPDVHTARFAPCLRLLIKVACQDLLHRY